MSKKIIFITGTDTGVGKTVMTAMLLHFLREKGVSALAMKPFCSGGLGDVRLLQSLQNGLISNEEMNPFYFKTPVAPWVAARAEGRKVSLQETLAKVQALTMKCDYLLIEGAGGLLSPLGEGFTALDLIRKLKCEVIVVTKNKLGVINQARLTMMALERVGKGSPTLILMDAKKADFATKTNEKGLAELLFPVEVLSIQDLGPGAKKTSGVKINCKKVKKTLAQLQEQYSLLSVLSIKK